MAGAKEMNRRIMALAYVAVSTVSCQTDPFANDPKNNINRAQIVCESQTEVRAKLSVDTDYYNTRGLRLEDGSYWLNEFWQLSQQDK